MVFARVIICFASLLLNVLDLKYNLAGLLFCILALKDGLWREFFVLASLLLCILALKDGFRESNYMFLRHCWLSHLSTLLCFIARWGSKQKGISQPASQFLLNLNIILNLKYHLIFNAIIIQILSKL